MDNRLGSEGFEIIKTLAFVDGRIKIIHRLEWQEPHHVDEENPIYIIVIDLNNNVIEKSLNYRGTRPSPIRYLTFDAEKTTSQTITLLKKELRFTTQPIFLNDIHRGWMITGTTFDHLANLQSDIFSTLLIVGPIGLIMVFLISSLIVRKALTPVLNISEKVRQINTLNLNKTLILLETNDEISHLTETINNLLIRLDSSFKTIRQFTANASHELKSPISIIQLEIEQLQKTQDNKQNPSFINIQNEIKNMAGLIDDLSTLAKMDTMKITVNKENVWLNDIVYNQIERYRQSARAKKIKIEAEHLPSISILADKHWMENLISNLLDNSIKFSPTDSTISITIDNNDPNKIQLNIQDEGPGIQPNKIENVTQRFYRGDYNKKIMGVGLGLSIVDWVVKAHHGDLELSNNSEKGLTASVILPK